MTLCLCTPAPIPYDHLLNSSLKCLAHLWEVRLIGAGWKREGPVWTHPDRIGLWTKEQAMDELEREEQ